MYVGRYMSSIAASYELSIIVLYIVRICDIY